MIKKIVLLSISAILFATVCVLGIRPGDVSYGRGNGQDAEIQTRQELAELLKSLRTTDQLFQTSASDDEIPYTSYSMTEYGSNRVQSDRTTENSTSQVRNASLSERSHTMDAYYTESAVYYHPVGQMTNSTIREVYELEDDGEKTLKSRQVDSTVQEYDMEVYLIEGKVYAKYNRIKVTFEKYTETRDEQGNLVRQADDEESVRAAEQMVECIRGSYGKWIDFSSEAIEETMDADSFESEKELFIRMLVSQISETYCQTMLGQNDQNIAYLNALGQALTGLSDGDVVEEKMYFQLSDAAAKDYFLQFGYSNEGEASPGTLTASFADASKPVVYQKARRTSFSLDGSGNDQAFSSKTTFFNLNNNVVSFQNQNVVSAYELFAPMLEELVNDMINDMEGGE